MAQGTDNRAVVPAGSSTGRSTGSPTDDAKREFAKHLTPCLQLASPTSLGAEEVRTWLAAAFKAIGDLPMHLIEQGAAVAMREAQFPSQIVPIINREVRAKFEERRAFDARCAEREAMIEDQRKMLEGPGWAKDGGETPGEILQRVWPNHTKFDVGYREGKLNLDPNRPTRTPTREDYIRLGVDPATLDAIAAERE